MLEEGSLFKDFEAKKEDKGKVDKGDIEIKIRFNKIWLERAIFIVVILILLVLIFYNPFCEYKFRGGIDDTSDIKVVKEEKNKSAEEVVIEEETPETKVEEMPKKEEEPKTEESKKQLLEKITLEIGDIELDVNKTKVQSITVKIDNQKKIFTPSLSLYWYDDKDTSIAKKPRNVVNYTGAIPTGTIKTWKLDDELKARYLTPDDTAKEIFKVELYDMSDNELLDTKTKTMNTD